MGANLHEHACAHVVGHVNVRTSNSTRAPSPGSGTRLSSRSLAPAPRPMSAGDRLREDEGRARGPGHPVSLRRLRLQLHARGVQMLDRPAVTLQPNVNRTRSRGWLTLQSADPAAPPFIQPNMLGVPGPETLVAGVKYGRACSRPAPSRPISSTSTSPGRRWTTRIWPNTCAGGIGGCFHPCGTCKMGWTRRRRCGRPRTGGRGRGTSGDRLVDHPADPERQHQRDQPRHRREGRGVRTRARIR